MRHSGRSRSSGSLKRASRKAWSSARPPSPPSSWTVTCRWMSKSGSSTHSSRAPSAGEMRGFQWNTGYRSTIRSCRTAITRLGVQSVVEPHHRLDDHEVLGRVHAQPEGVVGGELDLGRCLGCRCHGVMLPCRGGEGVVSGRPWTAPERRRLAARRLEFRYTWLKQQLIGARRWHCIPMQRTYARRRGAGPHRPGRPRTARCPRCTSATARPPLFEDCRLDGQALRLGPLHCRARGRS